MRRKKSTRTTTLVFICVFSFNYLFAQSNGNAIEESLITTFHHQLSPQIRLFNGVSYSGYFGKLEGNAYLDDNSDFVKGTVDYDGFTFKDVPILFDLVEEKLISLSHDGYNWYSLLNDRLASFTIDDRKFINLPLDSKDTKTRKHGFFEISYAGKMKVLIRRTKSIREFTEQNGVKKIFYQKEEYFIYRDQQLYHVSNDADILRLFADRKEELKKYLKSQKLRFREDPHKTLVSIVSYYEQL